MSENNQKTCKKGHTYPVAFRYCRQCEKSRKLLNRDNLRLTNAIYYQAHKEQILADKQKYQEIHKDRIKSYMKIWRIENSAKCAASASQYRAAKLKATPPWLNEAQLKEILEIYSLTKELQWLSEESLEVDHIVPLRGENVSGLHVPWNLQILPESLNLRKNNKPSIP